MERRLLSSTALLFVASVAFASAVYDFSVKSVDGSPETLSGFKGKTLLIVNVASKCGYTPQYAALQQLYVKYKDRGFAVLGFPANNFGGQEPGTNAEIKTFCSRNYNVTFPMFSKISVLGEDQAPLYKYLTEQSAAASTHGDIKWNFTKFLIARDGRVLARFEPNVTPDSPEIENAVEAALK